MLWAFPLFLKSSSPYSISFCCCCCCVSLIQKDLSLMHASQVICHWTIDAALGSGFDFLSRLQLMDSWSPIHLAFHINGSCLTGEWLTVFCFWTGKLATKSCKHTVHSLAVLCREFPYFMIRAWPHSIKRSHWCYSVFQVSLELHLSVLSRCLTSPLTMLYIPLKSSHRSLWRKTRGISMVYIC